MDAIDDLNRHKEKGFTSLKQFFQIKRPHKHVHSATLPRTKTTTNDDNNNVSKERLFVRRHSYRSNGKRNKYKKDRIQRDPNEKVAVEPENRVKRICQQFEILEIKEQNIISRNQRESYKNETSSKVSHFPAKYESQDIPDKQLSEKTEVKKRMYTKKSKEMRDKKIKSFAEAENDEETEEYRKSLIIEIDLQLARMKEDGFIDDDENVSRKLHLYEKQLEEETSFQEDTFMAHIQRNRDSIHSNGSLSEYNFTYTNEMQEEYVTNGTSQDDVLHDTFLAQMQRNSAIYHFDKNTDESKMNTFIEKEQKSLVNEENQADLEEEIDMDALNKRFQDEFSESFGEDDLENGFDILEAYNDDKRELIIVQVTIDRRNVNIDTPKSIEKAIKQSNMTFYQHEDSTFDVVQDINEMKQKSASEPNTGKENTNTSNRSTIYSVTSQDSSVEDDDEGIVIGRNKDHEELYQNARRETFCDNKGIVRIERVAYTDKFFFPDENIPSALSRSNSDISSKRLDFIIDEIKTTEKKYVEDLTKVVKVYKPYIESNTPPHLEDYQGYLFGNIEKIYRRQRKLLQDLENSTDVEEVIQCFIDHELLFEQYPRYFKNKPKADSCLKEFIPIIRDMQEKFEERLDFSAYLLTPVQRLGKYILLLEKIEKQLKKMGLPVDTVQVAINIVKEEMSKGNDSVAIESIENSPISKMDYGSFKMREKFNIIKPRKVDAAVVFLFTNVVVFTVPDQKNLETFHYYDSIKMNDLRIASFDDYTIHLTDFTKSKKKQNAYKYTYVLETKAEKNWKLWKEAIEKILWDQLLQVKETVLNESPSNRKKYIRTRSIGSSKFYCE